MEIYKWSVLINWTISLLSVFSYSIVHYVFPEVPFPCAIAWDSCFCRWLSGSDLKKVTLLGCPSVERKTVFAAKNLRTFFNIEEDTVSSLEFMSFFSMLLSDYFLMLFVMLLGMWTMWAKMHMQIREAKGRQKEEIGFGRCIEGPCSICLKFWASSAGIIQWNDGVYQQIAEGGS